MKEVHLICNAHIDPIWQWDWPEGVSAVLSTFQSAVNLAERFDYVFCHNEVTVYKYVEEYAPELFERIQQLVNAGKWHIMGGWYLQPDCNMPCGESFVRQIEEGKRYFKEKFGVYPKTAINFDPFGHSAGLVQIIKKCGQENYMFMRPYGTELKLPSEQFVWEGLDGSRIKAVRCVSYNTPYGGAARAIEDRADAQEQDVVCVLWGVGNHGGGPSAKDLADIEELKRIGGQTGKASYIHSTPEDFFPKINPDKVWDKSLRIAMPGCYTSMSRVKRKHVLLENEIYLTEKMLSAALSCGLLKDYPEDEMRDIVHDLLNAEFHDVLPGSSVPCGEDNGLKLLDHGLLQAERLKVRAYFALTRQQPPARDGEYPILVFNPHAYGVKENVECEFMLSDQNWSDDTVSVITVLDGCGNKVRHQTVKEDSNLSLDWRKRIIFEAELKPLQLARYSVYIEFKNKGQRKQTESFVFDDGRKRVEISKSTGLLEKYEINGVNYIKDGFLPVMFDDNPDPWGMQSFQQARLGTNEQAFELSREPKGVFTGMKSVQVIEDGDVYLGIEAFFERNETRARVCYKIYKNNDYVDVDVSLFFNDINKFVKLKVPVLTEGRLIGQTAFGTEELFTDARENVYQRFVAVDGGDKCLAILNNCIYGGHYENGAIYLSLARGVSYCAHPIADRPLIPTDKFVRKIDQGENNYSFRLGVMERSSLDRAAQIFVQKPYAQNIFPTPTSAADKGFDVSLEDETVTVVTIKKADGRDGIIFRLHNNTEESVCTALKVNGARLPLSFGRFEVKTVLLEGGVLTEREGLEI